MNILVVGSGGREHALAWRIAQSPRIQRVFVAPGNAGTALDEAIVNVPISDIQELIQFAQSEKIAYTVVGPEAPLAEGIVDQFRAAGLKILGPTKEAAQLETSKDFAKSFLVRHGIPTAQSQTFTDAESAHDYIRVRGAPIVVKADGLAAGKGVVVAMTEEQAHQAIDDMFSGKAVGEAGYRVLVEDYLEGEEASFIVLVNGGQMVPMATSQDHKRLLDGDAGPNTGGMGAYSPAPVVTPTLYAKVLREIIDPTLKGLQQDGIYYTGFLYAGLMIGANNDVKVLEFNCRMGDPETQVIMPRLKSDPAALFEAAIDGNLDKVEVEWDRRCAVGVVLASANYPAKPRTGDVIFGLNNELPNTVVFHAGTKLDDQQVKTSGGRVLCVVGQGDSFTMAKKLAYDRADTIVFDGRQMRTDIAYRVIRRQAVSADSSDE